MVPLTLVLSLLKFLLLMSMGVAVRTLSMLTDPANFFPN